MSLTYRARIMLKKQGQWYVNMEKLYLYQTVNLYQRLGTVSSRGEHPGKRVGRERIFCSASKF